MDQLITPDPDIYCRPGWCLQYVREAYGLPARHPSATAAWDASESRHRGRDFPPGIWTPVWYGLDTTPLGHVVLLAPDGSVYSTSDLTNTPHHHPDLADLEAYYAYYGMTLTYRGWTEDVAGYPVMTPSPITAHGALQEDDLGQLDTISEEAAQNLAGIVRGAIRDSPEIQGTQASVAFQEKYSVRMFEALATHTGFDAAGIAAQIKQELIAQLSK